MSDGLSRANQAGYKSKEENNEFCPHCLRGDIEITPVSKKYEIFTTHSTFYKLEYIMNDFKKGKWILYDENENVIDDSKLKETFIKLLKEKGYY